MTLKVTMTQEQLAEIMRAAYEDGHEDGYEDGHEAGYAEGGRTMSIHKWEGSVTYDKWMAYVEKAHKNRGKI